MPEGLITVAALASQPVLVFLCQAIVATTKEYVKLPTLLYAWIVGTVLVTLGQFALIPGCWASWVTYLLGILNGIVVAFAAAKAQDIAVTAEQKKGAL